MRVEISDVKEIKEISIQNDGSVHFTFPEYPGHIVKLVVLNSTGRSPIQNTQIIPCDDDGGKIIDTDINFIDGIRHRKGLPKSRQTAKDFAKLIQQRLTAINRTSSWITLSSSIKIKYMNSVVYEKPVGYELWYSFSADELHESTEKDKVVFAFLIRGSSNLVYLMASEIMKDVLKAKKMRNDNDWTHLMLNFTDGGLVLKLKTGRDNPPIIVNLDKEKHYTVQEIIDSKEDITPLDMLSVLDRPFFIGSRTLFDVVEAKTGYTPEQLNEQFDNPEHAVEFYKTVKKYTSWGKRLAYKHPKAKRTAEVAGALAAAFGLAAAVSALDSDEDNDLENLTTDAGASGDLNVQLTDDTSDIHYEELDVNWYAGGSLGTSINEQQDNINYDSVDIKELSAQEVGDNLKVILKLKGDFEFDDTDRTTYLMSLSEDYHLLISNKGILYKFGPRDSDYYQLPENFYSLNRNEFELNLDKRMLGDEEFKLGAIAYKHNSEPSQDPDYEKRYYYWIDKTGKILSWDDLDGDIGYIFNHLSPNQKDGRGLYDEVEEHPWGTRIKEPEIKDEPSPEPNDSGYAEPLAAAAMLSAAALAARRRINAQNSVNYDRKSDRLKRN